MKRKAATLDDEDPSKGFEIKDIKAFGKRVAAALCKPLDLKHLSARHYGGGRDTIRIASNPPLERDGKSVLVLIEPGSGAGIYLEIALDHEHEHGVCRITHVSLKLYTGASPSVAALRFRAEWDPRGEAKKHAQPHWNIDQSDEVSAPVPTGLAAPWVPPAKPAPWAPAPAPVAPAKAMLQTLSKFHFAMGSSFHIADNDTRHSSTLETEDCLLRWIVGCVAYTRAQILDMA